MIKNIAIVCISILFAQICLANTATKFLHEAFEPSKERKSLQVDFTRVTSQSEQSDLMNDRYKEALEKLGLLGLEKINQHSNKWTARVTSDGNKYRYFEPDLLESGSSIYMYDGHFYYKHNPVHKNITISSHPFNMADSLFKEVFCMSQVSDYVSLDDVTESHIDSEGFMTISATKNKRHFKFSIDTENNYRINTVSIFNDKGKEEEATLEYKNFNGVIFPNKIIIQGYAGDSQTSYLIEINVQEVAALGGNQEKSYHPSNLHELHNVFDTRVDPDFTYRVRGELLDKKTIIEFMDDDQKYLNYIDSLKTDN